MDVATSLSPFPFWTFDLLTIARLELSRFRLDSVA